MAMGKDIDLVNIDMLRSIALALPEVVEGLWFGTTGFKVRKTFFARLRDDDATLVLKVGFEYRDLLMQADPDTYYITDHYRGWPGLLVNLSRVDVDDLRDAFEQAWRLAAPAKLVAKFDKG